MSDFDYRWEVIVARNVDPPYRYSQEYTWLAVEAANQLEAIERSEAWAQENDYEATDMVRRATAHESSYSQLADSGQAVEVFWHLPVVNDMPAGAMVRHPVTGVRVGYLGWPEDHQRFRGDLEQRQYRLLVKKPSPGSEILGLVPVVSSLKYSWSRQISALG